MMQSATLLWQIRLSIHLSNAGIVSKPTDISSNFFDGVVGHHSSFLRLTAFRKFPGNSLRGALNTRENYANIAIYVRNGMRQAHSY